MFWTRGLLFQNLDAPKVRLGLNRPTIHLNSANFHVPQTGFSRILFLMDWILWHSDSPSGHKNTGYSKLSYPRFVHRVGFSVTCFGHTINWMLQDFVVQVLVKKHISPGLVILLFFLRVGFSIITCLSSLGHRQESFKAWLSIMSWSCNWISQDSLLSKFLSYNRQEILGSRLGFPSLGHRINLVFQVLVKEITCWGLCFPSVGHKDSHRLNMFKNLAFQIWSSILQEMAFQSYSKNMFKANSFS